MRSGALAAIIAALQILLAAPCPPSATAAEGRRELRIGMAGVPSVLDPATSLEGPTPLIARQVFETLVSYRLASTDIEPGLATRWGVSQDGLTWSFALRENARFHDGTALTSREVRASFERLMYATDPNHPSPNVVWPTLLRGLPGVVKALRAPDPYLFQIVLVQPYGPLVTVLAHPGFGVTRVATGADGVARLVGTGPYRVAEHSAGRIVLESPLEGRGDRLVIVDVGASQAEADLETRALDVWFPSTAPRRTEGVIAAAGLRIGILVLQTEKEPFSRRRVRQAIAAAIDPALLGAVLDRGSSPLQAFLPPGLWGRREGPPLLGGAPDAGRKLIASGEWPRGFTATLLAADAPGGGPQRVAEAIATALAAAQIPVRVRVEPPDRVRALTQAGNYDLALLDAAADGGDPHHLLYPLSTSEGAQKGPAATNVSFYRNSRVDDLLIRASQLGFRPERQRLYARAQALLAEDLPWIPIYVHGQWAVLRPEVRGFRLHPTGFPRLDQVTTEGAGAPAGPRP
jgi:peptide/nickel transport system substrate-binding protein